VVGWLGSQLLRRVRIPASGLFSLAVIGMAVLAYAGAAVLNSSGFLAVYVAALFLGNARLPHRAAVRGFAEGLGWLAHIGLFVLLGLLASPRRLPEQIWPALALGVVLAFIARPLSVGASVAVFRMSWRAQAFLSWAGLRGAVPVVLATVPFTTGVPGIRWLFDLVFVLVTRDVSRAYPAWIFGQINRFAIVFKIGESDCDRAACFHRVHQSETIEGRAFRFEAIGQIYGECFSFEIFRRRAFALD
jgi:NhaP-type Na+/H+ and K+/H+ antiporter